MGLRSGAMTQGWVRWLAALAGAAALSVHGAAATTVTLPVTVANPNVYGHCGTAVDPVRSLGALAIVPDTGRPWDGISNLTLAAGGYSPSVPAVPQLRVTLKLCGTIPRFPMNTGGGGVDAGIAYGACVDPNATNGLQLTGTGHRGQPLWDGPYPSRQGYKWCAFASATSGTAGNTVAWGAGFYDPTGVLTYYDQTQLVDAFGRPSVLAPSLAVGTNSATFYLPQQLLHASAAEAKPLVGGRKQAYEWVVFPGSRVTSTVAFTAPQTDGPPRGCCLLVNAGSGVSSAVGIADWVPGTEYCEEAVTGCGTASPAGLSNAYDLGWTPAPTPDLALVEPQLGTFTVASTWSYHDRLRGPSWRTVAGSPAGWLCDDPLPSLPVGVLACPRPGLAAPFEQDQGDSCSLAGTCDTGAATVPQTSVYQTVYGRAVPDSVCAVSARMCYSAVPWFPPSSLSWTAQ